MLFIRHIHQDLFANISFMSFSFINYQIDRDEFVSVWNIDIHVFYLDKCKRPIPVGRNPFFLGFTKH